LMLSVSGESSNLSNGMSSVWPRNEREISIELAAGIAFGIPKWEGGGAEKESECGYGEGWGGRFSHDAVIRYRPSARFLARL
jgi:hypothetical protein